MNYDKDWPLDDLEEILEDKDAEKGSVKGLKIAHKYYNDHDGLLDLNDYITIAEYGYADRYDDWDKQLAKKGHDTKISTDKFARWFHDNFNDGPIAAELLDGILRYSKSLEDKIEHYEFLRTTITDEVPDVVIDKIRIG